MSHGKTEKYRIDNKVRKPEAACERKYHEIHYYHKQIVAQKSEIGHIVYKYVIQTLGHCNGDKRHQKHKNHMPDFIERTVFDGH